MYRIKDKIDNPPESKDFQKVSHNLANFIKLKEEAKAGTYKRRRPNDDADEDKPGTQRPLSSAIKANISHRHSIEIPFYNSYRELRQRSEDQTTPKQQKFGRHSSLSK